MLEKSASRQTDFDRYCFQRIQPLNVRGRELGAATISKYLTNSNLILDRIQRTKYDEFLTLVFLKMLNNSPKTLQKS